MSFKNPDGSKEWKKYKIKNKTMLLITYNDKEEMMKIEKDGKVIFLGNYWDFSRNPKDLSVFLARCGLSLKITNDLPAIG